MLKDQRANSFDIINRFFMQFFQELCNHLGHVHEEELILNHMVIHLIQLHIAALHLWKGTWWWS